MKVTKTSDMSLLKTIEYLIATQGCDACPCCGNNRMITNYCRNYAKGLFKTKVYQINVFHCNDCGAEWESEPYEIS